MARKNQPHRKPDTATDQIAVLQDIFALNGGQLENFHPTPPPSVIQAFLRRASMPQLQGTLIELLAAMRNADRPAPSRPPGH